MGVLLNGSSWIQSTNAYNRASSDHTVMYWLRMDSTSGTRRPFGHTGAWEARATGGSSVLISDYLQSGTLGNATLTLGAWVHVAFVQNVSGGTRLAYVNGTLTGTVGSATFSGAQNANLSLGVTAGGAGQGWNGGIDDVRVYDRVVPQDEIQTIWACRGNDGILDALALWFPLDEGPEGASIAVPLVNRGSAGTGVNLVTVTGAPVFNHSCGIKRGKVVC